MRKSLPLLHFIFIVNLCFAQEPSYTAQIESPVPQLQSTASGTHLDSICTYSWSKCWKLNSKEINTYTDGNLTNHLVFDAKLQPNNRDIYIYDGQSRVIKKYHDSNLSSAPHRSYYVYSYDSNSHIILQIQTDTFTINSPQVYRDSFAYVNNLKVYQQRDFYSAPGATPTSSYYEWIYNSDSQLIQMNQGTISSGVKDLFYKEEYVYSNNNLESNTASSILSSVSTYSNKYVYEYADHRMTKKDYYTYSNSSWVKSYSYEYTYDDKANITKMIYAVPAENPNEMLPVYEELSNLSSNDLLIQKVRFNWSFYFWKNSLRTIYFYNQSQNVQTNWSELCNNNKLSTGLSVKSCTSAISNKEYEQSGIQLFPNPNQGNFTIRFAEIKPGKYNIHVSSIDGKLVYSSNINITDDNFSETINLNLNEGIYFVQIFSDKVVYKEKIVVQP